MAGSKSKPARHTKAPRLGHKKSKTGCHRCRARRVKCDETHPVCNNCIRHGVSCVFDEQKLSLSPNNCNTRSYVQSVSPNDSVSTNHLQSPKQPVSPNHTEGTDLHNSNILDFPESKSRRLLELKLLHHFVTVVTESFPHMSDPAIKKVWDNEIPRIAYDHTGLLYEIFSLSARHLYKMEPHNGQHLIVHERYFGLALMEHQKAIAELSSTNAEAVCATSVLMGLESFVTLQDRRIEPYRPPIEWLQMASGAASVFRLAWDWITDQKSSPMVRIAERYPYMKEIDVLFHENNRKDFLELLVPPVDGQEPWDSDIQEAYERTLSYIGAVYNAVGAGEAVMDTWRRLMGFPMLVPKEFNELVKAQQPRALAILAHFFALAVRLQPIWWIGNLAQREVRGIESVLPLEWKPLIRRPVAMVEGQL